MFPYHVYMEGGVVVESNLPLVPNFQPHASGNGSDSNDGKPTNNSVNASVSATI
jgi:hypothetical protein